MSVLSLDHVALPSNDPVAMMEFYAKLGFTLPDESLWRNVEKPRYSIHFGDQKINLQSPAVWQNPNAKLRGLTAVPGCGDLCFVWGGTMEELYAALQRANAPIVEGPVERVGGRAGGTGVGISVYTRDPDENLVEFILYEHK
jgi:catechol 2,3-dioxygenase-like lactoylglutathione lyase family enzyme